MFDRFQRPRPVAWFFFLSAMAVTLAAGTWQVERLQWKEGLIAELAASHLQAPRDGLPKDEAELKALQFHPVRIRGTWIPDTEFHITPRYYHDKFGYWIVSPLKLPDGRTLMVNRGWVPGKQKELESRPGTKVRGTAKFDGMVRVGAERNYFTPVNQPDKNIWFGRDIDEMAETAGLKNIVPVMVDVVEIPATKVVRITNPKLPVASDGNIRLRNDHLSYIITWYGIAFGVLVIFLVYHRKPR